MSTPTTDITCVSSQYRAVWLCELFEGLLEVETIERDIDVRERLLGANLELDDLRRRARRVRATWLQHLLAVLTSGDEIRHGAESNEQPLAA